MDLISTIREHMYHSGHDGVIKRELDMESGLSGKGSSFFVYLDQHAVQCMPRKVCLWKITKHFPKCYYRRCFF